MRTRRKKRETHSAMCYLHLIAAGTSNGSRWACYSGQSQAIVILTHMSCKHEANKTNPRQKETRQTTQRGLQFFAAGRSNSPSPTCKGPVSSEQSHRICAIHSCNKLYCTSVCLILENLYTLCTGGATPETWQWEANLKKLMEVV